MQINLNGVVDPDKFPYIIWWILFGFFVLYLVILNRVNSSRKKKQIEEIKARLWNRELTEEQKRFLTFGSIIFVHRYEKILEILPESLIDEHKKWLEEQWWISNNLSAKATISSLINLNKSTEIDSILWAETKEILKIKNDIAKALKLDISEVNAVKSTYAWDVVRAVSLAKWCFWCGFLTADEMWNYMENAVKIAEEKWENWKEYNISFLLGRTIHGFELLHIQNEASWLLEDEKIWNKEDNPYKIYNFK